MKESNKKPIKKTSSEWLRDDEFKDTEILEPLGWPEENWVDDFYKLDISKEEFMVRLLRSKIKIK